jgi:hypothetical protein
MIRTLPLFVALALLSAPTLAAEKGGKISKCQDTQGRWHYGDTAAKEYTRSKVTEITPQGYTKRVVDAPLTAEQLKAKAQETVKQTEETKRTEEKKRDDKIMLDSYASVADIERERERRLEDIQASISSSNETLNALEALQARNRANAAEEQRSGKPVAEMTTRAISTTEAQIKRHNDNIRAKSKEKEEVRAQFQAKIDRFKALTKDAPAPTQAATPVNPAPTPAPAPANK